LKCVKSKVIIGRAKKSNLSRSFFFLLVHSRMRTLSQQRVRRLRLNR